MLQSSTASVALITYIIVAAVTYQEVDYWWSWCYSNINHNRIELSTPIRPLSYSCNNKNHSTIAVLWRMAITTIITLMASIVSGTKYWFWRIHYVLYRTVASFDAWIDRIVWIYSLNVKLQFLIGLSFILIRSKLEYDLYKLIDVCDWPWTNYNFNSIIIIWISI